MRELPTITIMITDQSIFNMHNHRCVSWTIQRPIRHNSFVFQNLDPILRLQIRNTVDERANAADRDIKLAKLEAAQRQIGEQVVAELRATLDLKTAAVDFDCAFEKTRQALDRVRDEILGALVEDTAGLIAAFALNENVGLVPTDVSRYLQLLFRYIISQLIRASSLWDN